VSVALGIQRVKRMRRIVTCPALPCFLILSHTRHDFEEKLNRTYMYKLLNQLFALVSFCSKIFYTLKFLHLL